MSFTGRGNCQDMLRHVVEIWERENSRLERVSLCLSASSDRRSRRDVPARLIPRHRAKRWAKKPATFTRYCQRAGCTVQSLFQGRHLSPDHVSSQRCTLGINTTLQWNAPRLDSGFMNLVFFFFFLNLVYSEAESGFLFQNSSHINMFLEQIIIIIQSLV